MSNKTVVTYMCIECGSRYPIEGMRTLIDGLYSVNIDTGEQEFPVGACLDCTEEEEMRAVIRDDFDLTEYDIPHVDEIQQAKMEDEAELQEFLRAEAQLERGS